jgi:hypothetical protein
MYALFIVTTDSIACHFIVSYSTLSFYYWMFVLKVFCTFILSRKMV